TSTMSVSSDDTLQQEAPLFTSSELEDRVSDVSDEKHGEQYNIITTIHENVDETKHQNEPLFSQNEEMTTVSTSNDNILQETAPILDTTETNEILSNGIDTELDEVQNATSVENSLTAQSEQSLLQTTGIHHTSDHIDTSETDRKVEQDEKQEAQIDTHHHLESENIPSTLTAANTEKDEKETMGPDDILGNKSILKQTLVEGLKDTRPPRNCLATITYSLFLVDGGLLVDESRELKYFVGECEVIPAIDISIQLMNKQEKAQIQADSRHCYGTLAYAEKHIPPSSNLRIELELLDWQYAPEIHSITLKERLEWGERKRTLGNFYYRRKEYGSALTCYIGALKFLEDEEHPYCDYEDKDQLKLLKDCLILVQNNIGQANLLLKKYSPCIEALDRVLKLDENNVKAWYRKGRALFEQGSYDQAVPALRKALQLGPDDKKIVQDMLKECETKLTKYKENEKQFYQRMFQSQQQSSSKSKQKINKLKRNETDKRQTEKVS
ncbi:unnamed protein product, partial [Didymodactylos carnosus]